MRTTTQLRRDARRAMTSHMWRRATGSMPAEEGNGDVTLRRMSVYTSCPRTGRRLVEEEQRRPTNDGDRNGELALVTACASDIRPTANRASRRSTRREFTSPSAPLTRERPRELVLEVPEAELCDGLRDLGCAAGGRNPLEACIELEVLADRQRVEERIELRKRRNMREAPATEAQAPTRPPALAARPSPAGSTRRGGARGSAASRRRGRPAAPDLPSEQGRL